MSHKHAESSVAKRAAAAAESAVPGAHAGDDEARSPALSIEEDIIPAAAIEASRGRGSDGETSADIISAELPRDLASPESAMRDPIAVADDDGMSPGRDPLAIPGDAADLSRPRPGAIPVTFSHGERRCTAVLVIRVLPDGKKEWIEKRIPPGAAATLYLGPGDAFAGAVDASPIPQK